MHLYRKIGKMLPTQNVISIYSNSVDLCNLELMKCGLGKVRNAKLLIGRLRKFSFASAELR